MSSNSPFPHQDEKRHHVRLQPAYVLKRSDYRDSSQIIELFTPAFGRLGIIAKGVKRAKSPYAGVLEPFKPLLVSWKGRTDLPALTHAEERGGAWVSHGRNWLCACYLSELIMRFLHRHDVNALLFAHYGEALEQLSVLSGESPQHYAMQQRVLRLFEKTLLDETGYGLILDREAEQGAAVVAEQHYRYINGRGPVIANAEDEEAVSGRTLLALQSGELNDSAVLKESKRILSREIALHIGEQPLKSQAIWQSMQPWLGGKNKQTEEKKIE